MDLPDKLDPDAPDRVHANLDGFSPDAAELVLGFAFMEIAGREGIDLRTREMLNVAMLAAMGTAEGQLELHVRAAINTGVTREEIVEIILQVSVYAGASACMNAITAAKRASIATEGI